MGVCLHPCSIPGQQPTFMLKENEMEFGLGTSTIDQVKMHV